MIFGIVDTAGMSMDTMRVYFTQTVFHDAGGSDTSYIGEPSTHLSFSGDLVALDSLIAVLTGIYADGDSVAFTLDSAFSLDSCKVFPP